MVKADWVVACNILCELKITRIGLIVSLDEDRPIKTIFNFPLGMAMIPGNHVNQYFILNTVYHHTSRRHIE